jgi:hypothetical protein
VEVEERALGREREVFVLTVVVAQGGRHLGVKTLRGKRRVKKSCLDAF